MLSSLIIHSCLYQLTANISARITITVWFLFRIQNIRWECFQVKLLWFNQPASLIVQKIQMTQIYLSFFPYHSIKVNCQQRKRWRNLAVLGTFPSGRMEAYSFVTESQYHLSGTLVHFKNKSIKKKLSGYKLTGQHNYVCTCVWIA